MPETGSRPGRILKFLEAESLAWNGVHGDLTETE